MPCDPLSPYRFAGRDHLASVADGVFGNMVEQAEHGTGQLCPADGPVIEKGVAVG